MKRFIFICCAIAVAIGQNSDQDLVNSILTKIRTTTDFTSCPTSYPLIPGDTVIVPDCGFNVTFKADANNFVEEVFVVYLHHKPE